MIYSYSSLATYKQCPAKFNFAYIEKVEAPDLPPSPALERGTKIHDSIDQYIQRTNEFLHPEIHKDWGQYMHSIRESGAELRPEFAWGLTWEFEPCDYHDKRAMLHGYVDLLALPEDPTAPVDQYEWKTGKKYPNEHQNQTWMYAVAMLCHFPEREWVDSMIVYLDGHGHTQVKYPASMLFEYKPSLRREVGTVADATRFPPKPSFRCKWCKYSRINNSGPCQVG